MTDQSYLTDAHANAAGDFRDVAIDPEVAQIVRNTFALARESGVEYVKARGHAVRFLMTLDPKTYPDPSSALAAVQIALAG